MDRRGLPLGDFALLYQAVAGISLDSVTEKIAALSLKCLTTLANIPVASGAIIVHIYPLLAAGCEAARSVVSDDATDEAW